MRLFNTLTRREEEFSPSRDNTVRMYTCGLTVYARGHIGNFRTFVCVDVLRRTLKYLCGYTVTEVVNYTDVDDKTIAGAQKASVPLREYTSRWIDAFLEDASSLGLERPEETPRATDEPNLRAMTEMILSLERNGHTYRRDGSIYFNGSERLMKFDFASRQIIAMSTDFGDSPGMRCATGESSDHYIYGVTQGTHQLFRYNVPADELTLLGPVFLTGAYTTVIALSPDENYLYYLPGAHGKAYESGTPLVPVVGADNAGFVGQLNSVDGLVGAAVTNPGSIGGAGVALAVKILDGEKPAEQTTLVQPELWENATPEGKAKLKAAADPSLSPEWPVSISIPDWTTYSKEQIVACKGPGE